MPHLPRRCKSLWSKMLSRLMVLTCHLANIPCFQPTQLPLMGPWFLWDSLFSSETKTLRTGSSFGSSSSPSIRLSISQRRQSSLIKTRVLLRQLSRFFQRRGSFTAPFIVGKISRRSLEVGKGVHH